MHLLYIYQITIVTTNENITAETEWYFAQTYTTIYRYNNTYSSFNNPLWLGGSMGWLLRGFSGHDHLSKNLPSQSMDNSHLDFTATWSTDEKGRVIAGDLETVDIFYKTYKQSITYRYD